MSTITRRQVATGAAWAVPVIAVGAAAPAMAASPGCTTITLVTVTGQTNTSATLSIDFAEPLSGTYVLEILTVSGVSFGLPATVLYPFTGSALELTLPRTNTGPPSGVVTVTYSIRVLGALEVCITGAFTFEYTR